MGVFQNDHDRRVARNKPVSQKRNQFRTVLRSGLRRHGSSVRNTNQPRHQRKVLFTEIREKSL